MEVPREEVFVTGDTGRKEKPTLVFLKQKKRYFSLYPALPPSFLPLFFLSFSFSLYVSIYIFYLSIYLSIYLYLFGSFSQFFSLAKKRNRRLKIQEMKFGDLKKTWKREHETWNLLF